MRETYGLTEERLFIYETAVIGTCVTERRTSDLLVFNKGKGKAVLLQAGCGPECSRKLRFPDFMTTAQDGGKVFSLMHRPPLPPGNAGTHYC